MTDNQQALTDVLEMVEAGGKFLLTPCHKTEQLGGPISHLVRDAYKGSLDAAKALHEAVLVGWCTTHAWGSGKSWHWNLTKTVDGKNIYSCAKSSNPARAWLIALLKALIAQEGEA